MIFHCAFWRIFSHFKYARSILTSFRASERITKLKESKEKREGGGATKTEWKRDNNTEVEEVESGSEDEEWNGGLFMFPGTGGWRRAELLNSGTPAPDVADTAAGDFQISDDESDLPASTSGIYIFLGNLQIIRFFSSHFATVFL